MNDVAVMSSFNEDPDVSKVIVNPAAVLHLHAGDLVRVSNYGGTTGDITGSSSTMHSWFSITMLYAED